MLQTTGLPRPQSVGLSYNLLIYGDGGAAENLSIGVATGAGENVYFS